MRCPPTCWPLLLALGCGSGFADPSREFAAPVPDGPLHPVEIHQPATLGVVDADIADANGRALGAACETCHAGAAPVAAPADNPEGMHGAIALEHGDLSCDHCHDPADRSRLRLADGSTVGMPDAMLLCAQCHGPQRRDYDAGSHGGMRGHWDLRQGPRDRNHCLDCHSPHQPAYEPVESTFAPVDGRPHDSAHDDSARDSAPDSSPEASH